MAKKFSELRAKMDPERRAKNEVKVKIALTEMPLNELRNARGLSQKMLAESLHIQQPAIAKWKNERTCIYLLCEAILRLWAAILKLSLDFLMGM